MKQHFRAPPHRITWWKVKVKRAKKPNASSHGATTTTKKKGFRCTSLYGGGGGSTVKHEKWMSWNQWQRDGSFSTHTRHQCGYRWMFCHDWWWGKQKIFAWIHGHSIRYIWTLWRRINFAFFPSFLWRKKFFFPFPRASFICLVTQSGVVFLCVWLQKKLNYLVCFRVLKLNFYQKFVINTRKFAATGNLCCFYYW